MCWISEDEAELISCVTDSSVEGCLIETVVFIYWLSLFIPKQTAVNGLTTDFAVPLRPLTLTLWIARPLPLLTWGCWCSRYRWWGRTCRCHCSMRSRWPQTWTAPLPWSGESWRRWRSPHRPCCPQRWSGRQGSSRCWCSHLKYDIDESKKLNSAFFLISIFFFSWCKALWVSWKRWQNLKALLLLLLLLHFFYYLKVM